MGAREKKTAIARARERDCTSESKREKKNNLSVRQACSKVYNSCRIQKQKKEINGLKVKVIGFNGKETESEHVRWRERGRV